MEANLKMSSDILVVDDEADIRHLTAEILRDEGFSCREADSSEAALSALDDRVPDLIVLDSVCTIREMVSFNIIGS